MIDDPDSFAYYFSNPDDSIGFYEHELKKDSRKNNLTGDINYRYNNYLKYRDSTLARYVNKVVDLLPSNDEVRVKDLKQTLIKSYNLDNEFADRVVREAGSNDVRVRARNHSYNKSIDEIRLERI